MSELVSITKEEYAEYLALKKIVGSEKNLHEVAKKISNDIKLGNTKVLDESLVL